MLNSSSARSAPTSAFASSAHATKANAKKIVAGVQRMYTEKTDYYNHRVHWEFRHDEVRTPLGKLGAARGRSMPEDFELRFLATGRRFTRTVDGQGRISWKRLSSICSG